MLIWTGLNKYVTRCNFNPVNWTELLIGFWSSPGLWLNDLETCRSTRPTREIPTRGSTAAIEISSRDVVLFGGRQRVIQILDLRLKDSEVCTVWDARRQSNLGEITAVASADVFSSAVVSTHPHTTHIHTYIVPKASMRNTHIHFFLSYSPSSRFL